MSDLYTSAVHLKRLLAGQATPAFTPAPEVVLKTLDPDFFPGMGALNEDDQGRIQCPVRGCGEWHREIGRHMSRQHKSLNGAAGIKAALGIPRTTTLVSAKLKRVEACSPANRARLSTMRPLAVVAKKPWKRSAMADNISDTCPAQTGEKIAALARKLLHSPSYDEMIREYGPNVMSAVRKHFGTWLAAKAAVGLTKSQHPGKPQMHRRLVIESLAAWHDAHGRLPSASEVQHRNRLPWLPSYPTILRAFGVDTWGAAMQSVEMTIRKAQWTATG